MRTAEEFNTHYLKYLDQEDDKGLTIDEPQIVSYMDKIFHDLVKIEGFKYIFIGTSKGIPQFWSNLDVILPFAGRIIVQEVIEKITLMLKIEFEIETRLGTLNLDKYGKAL